MRKIGLIGGMSWFSTRTYYEDINQLVQARTSKLSSAPLLIESLDFEGLARLTTPEQWSHAAATLGESALKPRISTWLSPEECRSSPSAPGPAGG